jgi:hypothetical protein
LDDLRQGRARLGGARGGTRKDQRGAGERRNGL